MSRRLKSLLEDIEDEIMELQTELENSEEEVIRLKKRVCELEYEVEDLEGGLNNTKDNTLYDVQKSEILDELRQLSLTELEILRDNYKKILI